MKSMNLTGAIWIALFVASQALAADTSTESTPQTKPDWRSAQPEIKSRDLMDPMATRPAPAPTAPATPAPPKKAPLPAKAATGLLAQVLEYGYYAVEAEGELYADSNAPSGRVQAGATVKLVELTDQIPVEKGRLFGFRFRITGLDSTGTVEVREVVTHPKMNKPDGKTSTGYETKLGLNIQRGEVTDYAGYRLDNDYELVDGNWKFEFFLGDKKLLEQSFTTVSKRSRAKAEKKGAG